MQGPPGSLKRFSRFLVVGGLGFLADAGVLAALLVFGFGPLAARSASLTIAVLLTWRLNRLVFGPATDGAAYELGRYLTVVAASASVNSAVYVLVLAAVPALSPMVALMLGSAAGLALTFTGCDRFAFPSPRERVALTPPA